MTGYDASVLNNPKTRVLVIAPNWLGDGIMAMPALQTLRAQLHPDADLLLTARLGQVPLWKMHPSVSSVISQPVSTSHLYAAARQLKALNCTHALVIPHSFRSALPPFLAGIPHRRGTTTQLGRTFLIHEPVSLAELDTRHQQWEIAKLLLPGDFPEHLPAPELCPAAEDLHLAEALLRTLPAPRLGCVPGAARGPSKQWPGERFLEVAERWIAHTGGGVCWLGTPDDVELCGQLNESLGGHGLSLAGKTSLPLFTAVIQSLQKVLVNDSGGMHLAAAVGTPLVAVFGSTDPGKTGPLSDKAVVLQHAETRDRSIARTSDEARRALEAVSAEEAVKAVLANLDSGG
ncbi:MAG: lipopolysaccharide heptosyltransferase II [Kiritimatiellae bacterium]|nr:lipopolysaccharide heptosyltransferase II [Kiritimatiellia bacterium]